MEDTSESNQASESSKYGITPQQWTVLQQRMQGHSVEAVARAAGITARTIHRWQSEDAHYIAARNTLEQEMSDSVESLLLSGASDAADRVLRSIRIGNDTRTAVELLKSLGLYKRRATGPTTSDAVLREKELEKREMEVQVREHELAHLEKKLIQRFHEMRRERDRIENPPKSDPSTAA